MRNYQALVKRVLTQGERKGGPQAEDTLAIFGAQLRFSMKRGFPLITSRSLKGSWKALIHELLWFLSGSTHIRDLNRFGVHLWDQWATPAISGQMGLPPGELGPIYGKQWRSFGPNGIDQIERLIYGLKTNPNSRRHIVTTWSPEDADAVFVAPCHCFFQFFVAGGKLSLHLYQRSADVPVGVPFNIAEYALLLMMVAQVTGYEAGDFIHSFGDTHVYLNQISYMEELLRRDPRPLPQMRINPDVHDIFKFQFDDFELVGYDPHPAIKGIPVAL
ncbi:MAG: thymidylate synthase [Candidatus Ryanbacteria bacterium]|nr:thymidylate synthase [Candidatus Ryanbacteria bacterium]